MRDVQVYLAARYSRRDELRQYAADLRAAGYLVVCDWVNNDHDNMPSEVAAEIDIAEVLAADIVISFTEAPGPIVGRGRGGRHVEFGVALGAGKYVLVVGHRENVFHHLRAVEFYETWEAALHSLGRDRLVPATGPRSEASGRKGDTC